MTALTYKCHTQQVIACGKTNLLSRNNTWSRFPVRWSTYSFEKHKINFCRRFPHCKSDKSFRQESATFIIRRRIEKKIVLRLRINCVIKEQFNRSIVLCSAILGVSGLSLSWRKDNRKRNNIPLLVRGEDLISVESDRWILFFNLVYVDISQSDRYHWNSWFPSQ